MGVCCVHGWCVDGCYDNVSGQGGMVVCYACMVLWVVDGSVNVCCVGEYYV